MPKFINNYLLCTDYARFRQVNRLLIIIEQKFYIKKLAGHVGPSELPIGENGNKVKAFTANRMNRINPLLGHI
ncbi:MAG: hypothetical protein DHS20C01_31400 [marine bacterium B5-7]|nr:MAG: hypothetical protein DHS20C01_31400 [marine bacterium B5-7]